MRRVLRLLAVTVLCAAAPLLASAQSDEIVQRHQLALENLAASVSHLGSDTSASLDALESAASAMRLIERDTESSTLVPALEQAFMNARLAISNRSPADLEVQTAVLRGGFQRALLEASVATGSAAEARPGILQLATELGLTEETRTELAAAATLPSLLKQFQAGLARQLSAQLPEVAEQFPASRAAAYVSLADAYGASLSLQDAPEVPADLNSRFTQLINAVVEGEAEEVTGQATELATVLEEAAAGLSAAAQPEAEPAQVEDSGPPADAAAQAAAEDAAQPETEAMPEPAPAPAAVEPQQPAAEPEDVAVSVTEPEAPAAEAAEQAEPAEPAEEPQPADEQQAAVVPAEDTGAADAPPAVDVTALRAQLQVEQDEQAIAVLMNDLGRRGLRGQAGENLAGQLYSRGFSSVAQVLGDGLELAARSADAAGRGEQAAAAQHLNQLASHYRTNITALAGRMAPDADLRIRELLASLQAAPVLAPAELHTLAGLLASLGSGSGLSAQTSVQALAATWTGGWPRLVLVILGALLAIVPLVLLRMAFGNTNRNWTLIGSGLFLLLLPLFLTGLAAILDLAGLLSGSGLLHELAGWLTLSGSFQQVIMLVLQLVAVLLLALGTYGICRQFGLFGGLAGADGGRRRRGRTETRTLVDWDEEF